MAEQLESKKSYGMMDIVKLIMALLVITIHRRLGPDDSFLVYEDIYVVARLAVPFFFACSSFLLFSRHDDSASVFRFAKKNLRIYLIWFLIYLPFTAFKYFYSYNYGAVEIIKALLVDNLKFPLHLWFLPSLAISAVCVYFLTRKSESLGFGITIMLLMASFVYGIVNPQAEILSNSYITLITRTAFVGIPYAFIGYYLSRHTITIKKSTGIVFVVISVVASLLWGAYEFNNGSVAFAETRLTYIPAVLFLMVLCINYSPDKSYIKIRKASMLFYYTHLIIYQEILYIVLDLVGLNSLIQNRIAIFLITIAYTTVITALIIHLEDKKGFKWLKKLYN